jgi:hypothetical protein
VDTDAHQFGSWKFVERTVINISIADVHSASIASRLRASHFSPNSIVHGYKSDTCILRVSIPFEPNSQFPNFESRAPQPPFPGLLNSTSKTQLRVSASGDGGEHAQGYTSFDL